MDLLTPRKSPAVQSRYTHKSSAPPGVLLGSSVPVWPMKTPGYLVDGCQLSCQPSYAIFPRVHNTMDTCLHETAHFENMLICNLGTCEAVFSQLLPAADNIINSNLAWLRFSHCIQRRGCYVKEIHNHRWQKYVFSYATAVQCRS